MGLQSKNLGVHTTQLAGGLGQKAEKLEESFGGTLYANQENETTNNLGCGKWGRGKEKRNLQTHPKNWGQRYVWIED